ncbi:MAG: 6-phosphogluconolactonase [Chloroflexota bacterium]|nr:6-phosphogluconolactonase [Chloroflexota bacterium]
MSVPQTPRGHVERHADADATAQAAAELFVAQARIAQAQGRAFRVALSGGSTPREYHALLAASPLREQVDWSRIQFFWGDERCVPPNSPDSNFGMARETLLRHVPVSEAQIHRMRGEDDPAEAARAYEAEVRAVFGAGPGDIPRFDLIFTGMGTNGHTLSLFPYTKALAITDRLVTENAVRELNTTRITFTTTLANNAALVACVVVGHDKADPLAEVVEGAYNPDLYPAQLIASTHGELRYIVDASAASKLKRS